MKLDTYPIPYTKLNSIWICDSNMQQLETIKLSEDNKGQNLHDIGFGSDFLDMTPEA